MVSSNRSANLSVLIVIILFHKGTRRPDQDSGLSSGTNTTCSILSHDAPLNEEGSLNEGSYSEVFTDDEEQKEEQEKGEVQVIEGEVQAAIVHVVPRKDDQTVTLPTNRFAITNLNHKLMYMYWQSVI